MSRTSSLTRSLVLASIVAGCCVVLPGCGGHGKKLVAERVTLTDTEQSTVTEAKRMRVTGPLAMGPIVSGFADSPYRLAEKPLAPLSGWLTPQFVLSPDGGQIAYSTERKRGKGPIVLRLFSDAGTDTVVARGGFTPAWRGDGAIAYAHIVSTSAKSATWSSKKAEILVRAKPARAATKWSVKPAEYMVYGWANQHLIAYSQHECETLEVLAFDSPGESRTLGWGFIVAVDPSGEMVAIAPEVCGDDRLSGTLRVVRVSDGYVLAELPAAKVAAAVGKKSAPPVFIDYSGSWRGDTIAGAVGTHIVFFRYSRGHLSVSGAIPVMKRLGYVAEPVFLDEEATLVAATATSSDGKGNELGSHLVVCDRKTGTCKAGRAAALPRNVSRPQPGW
ncbi:MAG: hypothetical protein WBQ14_01235 [Gaiellaceae bacterium]